MGHKRETMICPRCKSKLKEVNVSVEGTRQKALSWQCPNCDYYSFEQESAKKVIESLKRTPLVMEHQIIGLSKNRLGIYLNSHIIKSLRLSKGQKISLSVPDKKHIVVELG